MAVAAIDDADLFLYRHPWATTEADNPVELLRALASDFEAINAENDELRSALEQAEKTDPDRLRALSDQVDALMAFVRRLHDDLKISDLEYEHARAIARRTPEHRAQVR